MDYIPVHDFKLPFKEMDRIQSIEKTVIVEKPLLHKPKYISGVDACYVHDYALYVIITFDFKTKTIN